jgi:hypothetical protein
VAADGRRRGRTEEKRVSEAMGVAGRGAETCSTVQRERR